jgi:hypothetical protein
MAPHDRSGTRQAYTRYISTTQQTCWQTGKLTGHGKSSGPVVQNSAPRRRWPPLAVLMPAMHKARLPSITFRRLQQELGNFFQLRHSPPGQLAGERRRAPCSKNVANWQTQFSFGRSLQCRMPLRRQLSLPTVANSTGKLANSFRASSPVAWEADPRSLPCSRRPNSVEMPQLSLATASRANRRSSHE